MSLRFGLLLVPVLILNIACARAQANVPTVPVSETREDSAAAYPEVALVLVHNRESDFCLGVLLSPQSLLTAAHCVAFNPKENARAESGTWSVVFPALQQTFTARSFELIDSQFMSLSRETYFARTDVRDLALLTLNRPVRGVSFPTIAQRSANMRAFAIQRRASVPLTDLFHSAPVALEESVDTLVLETARLTIPGDSGGPLFVHGTHALLGIEARFTDTRDVWSRIDDATQQWLKARIH
jgi:secreted trypsin-like serine protease